MDGPPWDLPEDSVLPPLADEEFDRMAALTKRVVGAPFATVTLVTQDCQVFPGLAGADAALEQARTNSLSYSLCQYVVRGGRPFVVADTHQESVLSDNLSVTELGVRAYAGMPVVDTAGRPIGTLCVMDFTPRQWSQFELDVLADLAAAVSSQLQLREVTARAAVTADRDRIAGELHRSVIRELFRLSMVLGSARSQVRGPAEGELRAAMDAVDAIIGRIRDSVFDVA